MGSHYILSAKKDYFFLIFSPLWALGLGCVLGRTSLADDAYLIGGYKQSFLAIVSGVVTMSHLVIVFFRSHMDLSIFSQHRKRFLITPVLLFTLMMLSSWILVFVFVLAVWWDVYHSALQTMGLGRIYDSKINAHVQWGRLEDKLINFAVYIIPIFSGISLSTHLIHFEWFRKVGSDAVSDIAFKIFYYQPFYAKPLAICLMLGIMTYAFHCFFLIKKGYRVSAQKMGLYLSTALTSVIAWGFNPMGQAFLIMNLFHAVQYFALICHFENKSTSNTLRISAYRWAKTASICLVILIGLSYGFWAHFWGQSSHLAMSILLTISICHFYFDGFIWSVSKKNTLTLQNR